MQRLLLLQELDLSVDRLTSRLNELEAGGELRDARARLAEMEEGSGRELVEIEQALAERRSEREQLTPQIPPDILELYQDIRRQKKGVGAAALVDGVCQACHQQLSPMYLDRLKRTEGVRRCEYCRRILVLT